MGKVLPKRAGSWVVNVSEELLNADFLGFLGSDGARNVSPCLFGGFSVFPDFGFGNVGLSWKAAE